MRVLILAAAAGLLASTGASAAPCKDSHGKFIKCPPPRPMAVRCKDIHGKFTKCGMPGAKPV